MPGKQSAHAELDGLRRDLAREHARVRGFEAEVEAAKAEVEEAGRAVVDAYAEGSEKAAGAARAREQTAAEKLKDLGHRLAGAAVRAERAGERVEAFQTERAGGPARRGRGRRSRDDAKPAARGPRDWPPLASVQGGPRGDSAPRQPCGARRRSGERPTRGLRLGTRAARTRARTQAGRRPRAAAGSLARERLATPGERGGEAPPRGAGRCHSSHVAVAARS
jgi:hypothetical protein